MKTATVRARVEPELKVEVEGILNELGLSVSEAIELYMRQIKLNHGIPFMIKVPNELTQQTMADTDRGNNLHRHKSADDMFDKLGF